MDDRLSTAILQVFLQRIMTLHSTHFDQITKAIFYLVREQKRQPDLQELAAYLHMDSFHLQKLFTKYVGMSPKKFLQYITLNQAKKLLLEYSLLDTTNQLGLSSPSRLHDLFVRFESMTPGEYKQSAQGMTIRYSFVPTILGEALIASTAKGVCYLAFAEDHEDAMKRLRGRFPLVALVEGTDTHQQAALAALENPAREHDISLHVRGTPFQIKVWEALLQTPKNSVTTYGQLAKSIDNPKAVRAVGTAVGDNPVAILIPCHRVVRASGALGGYHWGLPRKEALLAMEGYARLEKTASSSI